MKELLFNFNYMVKKREFYFAIISIFLINIVHVVFCVFDTNRLNYFVENCFTGEYQFILYNAHVMFNVLIIIAFPIILALVFSDSSWLEHKNKTINLLNTRFNYKRNIIIRTLLSFFMTFIIAFVGFILNYLLLRIIYDTGNHVTYFQSLSFNLEINNDWFFDTLRIANPSLFVVVISCLVSITLGLLSALSYLLSFFVKQRVVIYFIPLVFLISSELIFSIFDVNTISFISMLQPFSKLSTYGFVYGALILLCLNIILLFINLRKKDVLV